MAKNQTASTVVNVLATGSVSAAKFTAVQLASMDADLRTLGKSAFTEDKATGGTWRKLVLACERNGIVIKELQKTLAKHTVARYIEAWCEGLKVKELTATQDKDVRAKASNHVSLAFKRYRTTPAVGKKRSATSEASNTSKGGTTSDGLSVGNSIPGIIEVQALIANALKVQTAARERMVALQADMAKAHIDSIIIESAGLAATAIADVQDDLAKLDKLLAA